MTIPEDSDFTELHAAEALWREQAAYITYPKGVIAVPEPILGTAFFPGGYGLWNPAGLRPLPAFPRRGVMIVGHDFHSEVGYWASQRREMENLKQPTWRNLRQIFAMPTSESPYFGANVDMGSDHTNS